MQSAEEILKEKTKDYTQYPSKSLILSAMEEYAKQSYIEASNFTHKSLIETLAKEINAISIDCNSNELTIINKVFLILEKYGYKR
jgi:hypothetical protein